jgi:hypothetical protein
VQCTVALVLKDIEMTEKEAEKMVEKRYNYAEKPCTLNGKPAKITGMALPHAVVSSETEKYEWSWPAVYRIMDKYNGKFKS